jgi:hypothetical protein
MTRAGAWRDADWAQVVLWFVALNILDLGLTLHLVARGAVEMNPVMAHLLDAGWEYATTFKLVVTFGVAVGLWSGRRHRVVRQTGVAFLVIFAAVLTHMLVGLWMAG